MNEINKSFFDICWKILLANSNDFSVLQIIKDIDEGQNLLSKVPWENSTLFLYKKQDVLNYITKVRAGNIIDSFIDENCIFALDLKLSKGPITVLNADGLRFNLQIELCRLILKGMYQVIKNKYKQLEADKIVTDFTFQDISILQNYNLVEFEGKFNA